MRIAMIAGAVVAALTASTVVQAKTFYVVQDTATKKCTVVNKKPTVKTTTIVGDGAVYKTKTEARTGMKSIKVCSSN